jgi:hypothetical protein
MRLSRRVIAATVFSIAGALGASAPVLAAGGGSEKPAELPYVVQCTTGVSVDGDIYTSSATAAPSAIAVAPEGCTVTER